MEQLYITVQYFYITNQLTLEKISRAIYTPIENLKNNYLTKTIHGELIDINRLELNKKNSTKHILSKRVRLQVLNHPNIIIIYTYLYMWVYKSVLEFKQ